MDDVITIIVPSADINYGTTIFCTGAKRGELATQEKVDRIVVYNTIDDTLFERLNSRLDDPTYYTA